MNGHIKIGRQKKKVFFKLLKVHIKVGKVRKIMKNKKDKET